MPSRPKHPCNWPMCPNLTHERYCPTHKKQTAREYNATRDPVTEKWRKSKRFVVKRKWFLKRNPLCMTCKQNGRDVPATQLDHIEAHQGNYDLFWNMDNWQGLCRSCHSRKTVKQDGGFGKQWPLGVFPWGLLYVG